MTRTFTLHPPGAPSSRLNLERDLNDQQRAAVTCGDGPKLVIAGAGSGKTRTITYRVAYLIMVRRVHPSHLMLATFTNKAAREMLSRVEALTGSDAAKVWGGTFHAIGNRLLRQHGKRVGLQPNYTILDEEDQRDLLKVCVTQARVKTDAKRFPTPAVLQELISMSFNTERSLRDVVAERTPRFSDWIEELQAVSRLYHQKKRAANAVDYDDLLHFWLLLLEEHPDVARRLGGQFRHVLVDEYQDTNAVQARIVERIAEHNGRNLMVVGDDAQCVMAGTRVLTPGGYRSVESLRVGDLVLAGAGNSRLVPERVRVVTPSRHERYVVIRVEGGFELRASPNHLCFAKVVYQTKWWYVSLMYREGLGFRIGVSHISRQGRLSSTPQMWTAHEHADKFWLLEAHPSRQLAQDRELVLRLRYRVPQGLFRPDWHAGSASKMTKKQVAEVFGEFGHSGHQLLEEYGLHFDYPSFQPKASRSRRRIAINLVMAAAKNGDGRGIDQAHELTVESELGEDAVKGLPVSRMPNGYWRLHSMGRDYKPLLEMAKELNTRLRAAGHHASIHYKARFVPAKHFSGTFRTVPAAGVLPGLQVPVVQDGRIVVATVESVEWKENRDGTLFYDIEVERSHNMVSEGIVTHNSIYRFRGANYDNILNFPERNPGTELFKLEVNYRSTPQILAFTNASIRHNPHQYAKTLLAQRAGGCLPVVVPLNDVYQEAAFVAQRLLQLRDEDVPLADMAVLYRAHAHSTILQAELLKRNIPYEVRSGVRFFEQAHIKDVVAHLKLLDNPFDEVAWRRLLLMLPRVGNVTAAKLWERLASSANPLRAAMDPAVCDLVPPAARPHVKRFQQDLAALAALAEDGEPSALVQAVLQGAYLDYLRAHYGSFQSRLEDIQQLAVFARPYRSLQGLLSELLLLGELYGQDVHGGASMDTERLVLSSIHQAKGLEWSVVFVIRMCEGAFPSGIALHEPDGEEEERRIFYVATTRAKDELYITHPLMDTSLRGDHQLLLKPSRFLHEIDFRLYEPGEIEELPIASTEAIDVE